MPWPQARYDLLDMFRGVACLCIVLLHSAICVLSTQSELSPTIMFIRRFGYLGVPMFFVISGYCIAATLDSHRYSQRAGWTFLWRRFKRIYPSYWVWMACMVVLFLVFEALGSNLFYEKKVRFYSPQSLNLIQWIGNLALVETWRYHLFGGPQHFFNEISWTLCYEEQFYLICFLTLLAARRRFFKAIFWITVWVTVVWFLALAARLSHCLQGTFVDWGWWEFACGVGVYYRLNYAKEGPSRRIADVVTWIVGLTILPTLLVLAAFCGRVDTTRFINPYLSLAFSIMFALLLIILRPIDNKITEFRAVRLLSFLGVISYSLYLVHYPICKLVCVIFSRIGFWTASRALLGTIPACVVISVILAYVFHQAVEKHFLSRPHLKPAFRPANRAKRLLRNLIVTTSYKPA